MRVAYGQIVVRRAALRRHGSLALLAAMVVGGAFLPRNGMGLPLSLAGSPVAAATFAAASLVAVLLLPRRRWPLIAVGLLGWLLLSAWVTLCVGSYLVTEATRRVPLLLGYFAGATAVAVLPTVLGVLISMPGLGGDDALGSIGGAALFVWLPLVIGLWNRARLDVLEGLRERAAQLEREQTARAEQARLHERTHIAREMHDVVAHRVSLMVLHAGGLEVNAQDPRTAATAELIRVTGKEALVQLRNVLGVLKEGEVGPQPTLADLDRLLAQSREAGIPVVRHDAGTPLPLPVLIEQAAYRVVQEALTNVHKHSGTARTDVELRYTRTEVEVTVINEAPRDRVEPLPGTGMGLIGLRERVKLLDGEFTAGPTDGGFTVRARFPLGAAAS
ncbi:Signal transduction histidine kinase [Saccharopolyspora antimicrobica]|uniref:histidine kinase n=1 Tax=Saccharopolyspora antimicrobica TaxID=455193 RepID=A0A1I5IMV3_9PSEU|nr:signal transduction histidine kinase [Saccharopolyspora antimicrobica]SFO61804.1 Signal transduction histidine kinase [Saccharopolyspora antimicrobica]